MTIDEAIRILDPKTTVEALAEIEYYGGFRGDEAMTKACDDACIIAVETMKRSRWIPVSERLPEEKGCYLVSVNHWLDGKPVTREAIWNGADWLSGEKRREITPRATHWQPLPEPPEEGGAGDA